MKRTLLTAGIIALLTSTAAFGQYPANGYIGVYDDAAGTDCCIDALLFTPKTAYVIANLAGETAGGLTGVEFRLELSADPTGHYIISFAASPTAAAVVGTNLIDITPGSTSDDPKGLNIAWGTCQNSDPSAGAGRVLLGTLSIIQTNAAAPPLTILSKRRSPANAIAYDCPLIVLCDDPNFTIWCLTVGNEDPILEGNEAISFRSFLNTPGCNGDCGPVAVTPTTWSTLKDLFR
jgi:hypothetical protein